MKNVGFAVRIMVYTGELPKERLGELDGMAVDAAVEKTIESGTLLNLIRQILTGNPGA